MFKSFFPKPGTFFLSAFVWALIAVIFWQAGGGDWVARITGASGQIPISAARFWSLDSGFWWKSGSPSTPGMHRSMI